MKETDLYPPVKAHLEAHGFTVKGEIGPADVVGMRGEDMVVVELKRGFSLTLFHQGIARLAVCDCVYLAVAKGRGRPWLKALRENVRMARRLGLGVMGVDVEAGTVKVYAEPGPYTPRKVARKRRMIVSEFERREGDPNLGGLQGARVTAYRQEATLCAEFLALAGAAKGAEVAKSTGVARATLIMRSNHYGWFEKVSTGVYRLNEAGRAALSE
ncbi:DUF2161 domain-containing phosphodiesterase [Gymnodinialimonas ceratoperidinii]|uniref:Uncharacterized protein n=1 Tax=Gymnodinialimonas ceratoperidinii TaxID=2856823 RepID=A0A8F6TXF8_9RHOB|nr:DUF2161 family putative PD-(D/E)XK-type phosphodiesterase [Gymnodinialimonas ceratoperidinii]QXT40707.1 hypothetical protein KYE46_05585 [Gymnodinialimonas ceratoperidinii]